MSDIGTLASVITREDLQKMLISVGIDGDYIGNVIKDGLTASKKDGPDHGSRFKYLQLALELLDITHSQPKEEDGFEFYKGKFRDLTDEQLEEESNRELAKLQKFPE